MPSSVLNSDDGVISGTSGIKAVGGDDGVLVFQSKGTETARINTDKQIVAAAGTASLPIYSTTGDLNTGIYFPAADNIGFATNGVIRGRWTTDGLCFGTDTAAANALDDYEEGTFTPVASGSSSAGTGTYYRQVGRYTKIGRLVTIQVSLAWSAHTGTGNLQVSIPITADSTAENYVSISSFLQLMTLPANSYVQGVVIPGTVRIDVYSYPTGGGATAALTLDAAAEIIYSVSYIAA